MRVSSPLKLLVTFEITVLSNARSVRLRTKRQIDVGIILSPKRPVNVERKEI